MTELTAETLLDKYPLLKEEIVNLLGWWRKELERFEIPNSDSRMDAETMYAGHEDVYERLSLHRNTNQSGDGDKNMRTHNHQLFDLLMNEFGWKDRDGIYPNPDDIF